jgi:hypothetical protein
VVSGCKNRATCISQEELGDIRQVPSINHQPSPNKISTHMKKLSLLGLATLALLIAPRCEFCAERLDFALLCWRND